MVDGQDKFILYSFTIYILRKLIVWWLLCGLLVRKYVCLKPLQPILGVIIILFFSLFFLVGPIKLFQIIFFSPSHVDACSAFE